MFKPKASLICVEKITRAIPLVKPTTKECGKYFNKDPRRNMPKSIKKNPAIIDEIIRPFKPYFSTIPKRITIKAPVGPPICTRLPPNKDIINPAITAVIRPFSGETPEATANAIANGKATIPTTTPANKSVVICFLEMPVFTKLNNLGLKTFFIKVN